MVALAKKHQAVGDSQPLSMAILFTPAGVQPSVEEIEFRRRAIELGKQFSTDVSCEEAIVEIVRMLAREGLHCPPQSIDREMVNMLDNQIGDVNRSEEMVKVLRIYHFLLWKTAGDESWTVRRNPGESNSIPYLPHFLLANQTRMEAETVLSKRMAQIEEEQLSSGLMRVLASAEELSGETVLNPQDWTEVSLMEFINGCLSDEHCLTEERSQPITQVITTKDRRLTWKEAQDSDNQRGDIIFANQAGEGDGEGEERKYYVRSKSDIRTLYEMRPPRMSNMVFGFFASKYRRMWPSGNGFEAAKNKIDPSTGLGPDSTEKIVGDDDLMAPQCMQLSNEVVMVKRAKGAVLHCLFDGKTGRHGNQVLWESWRYLEEITDQDQGVTEEQTRRRLEVFPLSKRQGEDDSDSE